MHAQLLRRWRERDVGPEKTRMRTRDDYYLLQPSKARGRKTHRAVTSTAPGTWWAITRRVPSKPTMMKRMMMKRMMMMMMMMMGLPQPTRNGWDRWCFFLETQNPNRPNPADSPRRRSLLQLRQILQMSSCHQQWWREGKEAAY